MKLTIVLPTYNEADNLPLLVTDLMALQIDGIEQHILIVDDNSPDGTGHIGDRLSVKFPGRVQVLHRREKDGLGKAIIEGLIIALYDGADYILQMDADFSHQPRYIPSMLEAINDCDMVQGSRYTRGGSVDESWAWWRKLLSWFANSVYLKAILRSQVNDLTGGFKLWQRDTLIGIDLPSIRSNGYIFQVEITYAALQLGYKVIEVPIYFPDRNRGESKMSFLVQYEAALRAFQVWWRRRHLTPRDRTTELPPSPVVEAVTV
jgi:dolichol-phosphate mannosyltransferase